MMIEDVKPNSRKICGNCQFSFDDKCSFYPHCQHPRVIKAFGRYGYPLSSGQHDWLLGMGCGRFSHKRPA